MIECLTLVLCFLVIRRILKHTDSHPIRSVTTHWLNLSQNTVLNTNPKQSENLEAILNSLSAVIKSGKNHQEWKQRITKLLIKSGTSIQESCVIHRMIALRLAITSLSFFCVYYFNTYDKHPITDGRSPTLLFAVTMIYIWTIYYSFSYFTPRPWFFFISLTTKAEQYLSILTACYIPTKVDNILPPAIARLTKQEKSLGLNLHPEKLAYIDAIEHAHFSKDTQKMQRFRDALPLVDLAAMLPVILSAVSL